MYFKQKLFKFLLYIYIYEKLLDITYKYEYMTYFLLLYDI